MNTTKGEKSSPSAPGVRDKLVPHPSGRDIFFAAASSKVLRGISLERCEVTTRRTPTLVITPRRGVVVAGVTTPRYMPLVMAHQGAIPS